MLRENKWLFNSARKEEEALKMPTSYPPTCRRHFAKTIDPPNDDPLVRDSSASNEDMGNENPPLEESSSSVPTSLDTGDADSSESGVHLSEIPGTRARNGRQLAMVFTCGVCDTRSVKQFTERSYTQGVVMVQCGGCQNWHVLADNLGYFGDDTVKTESLQNLPTVGADGVLEVDLDALLGKDKIQDMVSSVTDASANKK